MVLKFTSKKRTFFPIFSILVWILTLLAMIISFYYKDTFNLNNLFAINPSQFVKQLDQSWWHILKLTSSLFLHGSWQHWAGNMILFLLIALPLEKRVGGFWFLLIYFTSGFIGNMTCIYQFGESNHFLLGASGAVSGLLGAWLMLFPSHKISIIIPIGLYLQKAKIPILILAFIWLSIQIILQFINFKDFSIAWASHIVGFMSGFFVAWLYRVFK